LETFCAIRRRGEGWIETAQRHGRGGQGGCAEAEETNPGCHNELPMCLHEVLQL
jgi:hypothetical protein